MARRAILGQADIDPAPPRNDQTPVVILDVFWHYFVLRVAFFYRACALTSTVAIR